MNPSSPEVSRCGSAGYVASEILNKRDYDVQADMFSVGVVFYVM
jgi:serine/threonine protein kinase